jgi:hypothetical protein
MMSRELVIFWEYGDVIRGVLVAFFHRVPFGDANGESVV